MPCHGRTPREEIPGPWGSGRDPLCPARTEKGLLPPSFAPFPELNGGQSGVWDGRRRPVRLHDVANSSSALLRDDVHQPPDQLWIEHDPSRLHRGPLPSSHVRNRSVGLARPNRGEGTRVADCAARTGRPRRQPRRREGSGQRQDAFRKASARQGRTRQRRAWPWPRWRRAAAAEARAARR